MKRGVLVSISSRMRRLIGSQRAAGLGHFDDGVGQARRFDLGGAPTEFDFGRHAMPLQIALCETDRLGRDALALPDP